ncbi:MAG: hypothetical protein M0018_03345 [Nitrospiraceae bacterium]|nr:hypothetical protein [Nitrospiraceae bacterium]
MNRWKKLWVLLAVLIVLTPVGIIFSGGGWGEWGASELKKTTGYVPGGFKRYSGLWNAPAGGYRIRHMGGKAGYLLSALAGAVIIVIAALAIGKALTRDAGKPKG